MAISRTSAGRNHPAPANRYFEAARKRGDPIERRVMPGAGHFELIVPASSNWVVVRDALARIQDLLTAD